MTVDLDGALKALASPVRRDIIRTLSHSGELCACEFTSLFDLAPSTISHHMAILVGQGLVRARKQGTWVHYEFDGDLFAQLIRDIGTLADQGGDSGN